MPRHPHTINPNAIKNARKKRGLTQQELADAIRAKAKAGTKDTVSRWERGKSSTVRPYIRKALCEVLGVKWEDLTSPISQPSDIFLDPTVKVSISERARAALRLVAVRYQIPPREVLDIAPLLFLLAAERSLLERKRRLQVMDEVMDEADEKLRKNRAHLGAIFARRVDADNELYEEEKSLAKRDVFGRTIDYQNWGREDVGPFVHFVRELAEDLPKGAVDSIESIRGDMVGTYEIAADTLRDCTGISEEEEHGAELLDYLRRGLIDFAECLRVKRAEDEAGYRQWLSDQLHRAKDEYERRQRDFIMSIGLDPTEFNEPPASEGTGCS